MLGTISNMLINQGNCRLYLHEETSGSEHYFLMLSLNNLCTSTDLFKKCLKIIYQFGPKALYIIYLRAVEFIKKHP